MTRGLVLAGLALCAWVPAAAPQAAEITGYYLNVGTGVAAGPFNESAAADFQRLRLMWTPDLGGIALELAYEHTLDVRSRDVGGGIALGLGPSPGAGEWLGLQGTIEASAHATWRHRLDRAAITVPFGPVLELTVGRQPVSWATTLLLTPGDPFVPFNPEDPFREYRAGVDAARLRVVLGPFTDLDFVLRPAKFPHGSETLSALGRVRSVIGGVEIGAWLGALHDEWAGSAAATATFAGTAARAELVVREIAGHARVRFAVGLDRRFPLAERDLYVILEYQRDELGAASAGELPAVLTSEPARRGELLALGRDAAALQAVFSVHPLWTIDALALASLNDPSLLLGPAASRSLGAETSLRAGVFVGLGPGSTAAGAPASEYGPVPLVGYASFTLFF